MLCVLTMSVRAVEVPDLSRRGSIHIAVTFEGKAVSGGTLTLYCVAAVQVENGADYSFAYVQDYESCAVFLENLTSANTAQELADFTVQNEIKGTRLEIDTKGCVTFEDLELGLYLLVQETPAKGYEALAPFLVSVPAMENGTYVYDVDASPKLQIEQEPTEPTTKPTEPPTDDELPQTGQTKWPIPILSVLGLGMVIMGYCCIVAGRKNKDEN